MQNSVQVLMVHQNPSELLQGREQAGGVSDASQRHRPAACEGRQGSVLQGCIITTPPVGKLEKAIAGPVTFSSCTTNACVASNFRLLLEARLD